jgi:hypothetical protein
MTTDSKAVGYIADLQRRAGLEGNITAISLEDVFAETTKELFWEGQRRTILIRYDRYLSDTYLWPFKGGVENGVGFNKNLELFPLPADDLLANDNLTQNPGYNN